MEDKQTKIGEIYLGKLDLESDDFKQRIGKGTLTTHVSLFTGCGGMDLGFSRAGIETRVMIEHDHSACETLRANWTWEKLKERRHSHYETEDGKLWNGNRYTGDETEDGRKLKYVADELVWETKEDFLKEADIYFEELERRKQSGEERDDDYQFAMAKPPSVWYHEREPVIFESDICEVTSQQILESGDLVIGECSIVSGGFPCQGFSMAGKRVVDDPRNKLYKQFVRIVRDIKPASIMGENVQGLISMAQGHVIHQICEDFANLGYDVAWSLLNAADYGVPQNRKRVILIGTRVDAMKFDEEQRPSFHICASPGEIQHPKLFEKRLKTWSKLKDKEKLGRAIELLKRIREDPRCSFKNMAGESLEEEV